MANTLRIKRRSASGGAGAPSSLANAELAFNESSNVMYYGTGTGGAGGSASQIIAVGGDGAFLGLAAGLTQTAAGAYTFTGTASFTGTTSIGAATATSPLTADDSTRVATTEWVKDQGFLTSASNGTVTSVGLSLPNIFSVSGSPITSSGTLAASLTSQSSNVIFAGPATGAAAAPTFRSLVAADIPDLSATYLTLTGTRTASGTYTFSGSVNFTGTQQIGGVTVTADAAEINVLDGATAGSAVASKAVVLDANRDFNFGTGDVTCTDLTTSGNVTIGGSLVVNGSVSTINSTTITVDDKNLELGSTASPTDASADGGGITLKGTTDKTFQWVDATDAWTSSEHMNLLAGRSYYIGGTSVLSASSLGSGVTASSLTSVGTIATGVWQGTAVAVGYGGLGLTSAVNGLLKGNGTSYAAAVAGTDYLSPSSEIDGGVF